MFKPIGRLISAASLALVTAVAVAAANYLPWLWFRFYTGFSRSAMTAIGSATGWIPFCVWQVLLVLLVLSIPVGLIVAISKKRVIGFLAGLVETAALLIFLFVGLWGLNHFAPTIGEQIGLEVRESTVMELADATRWYAQQAGEWSQRVERDESGDVILPDHATLSRMAVESYVRLAGQNERFAGTAQRVKPLFASKAFSYMGTTGIFVCLTGEAAVNTDAYPLCIPFTMCHELGHSLAVAAEDQANYCGYLACAASDDPLMRYSGYFNAYLYCVKALRRSDNDAANKIWNECSELVVRDSNAYSAYNKQYEGKVQNAVQSVNDSYLKAFHQSEGVKSYGLVVDYLIAEYRRNR